MEKLREINSRAVMEAVNRPPFGPGFSEEDLASADTMEIWSIEEARGVEYRLLRLGVVVAVHRVSAL